MKKFVSRDELDIITKMADLLNKEKTKEFELPSNHVPGLKVPKGGSCCANCKFGSEVDGKSHCTNDYFVKWHGESKLPAPADEYCSDWWTPKEGKDESRE